MPRLARGPEPGDHEVLAVDDGSRDGSGGLLEERRQRDPRLRVRHNAAARPRQCSQPGAVGGARAPGGAHGRRRLDAPRRLARQAHLLDRNPPSMCWAAGCAPWAPWAEACGATWPGRTALDHEAITRDLFVESPLVHPSVMLRTAALCELAATAKRRPGGLRPLAACGGGGLALREAAETLLEWRDRPDRLTRCDAAIRPSGSRRASSRRSRRRYSGPAGRS